VSSDLEKRVKALEDERAIQDTINAYGHCIDYGLKEEWLDLFTDDATYQLTMLGKTTPMLMNIPQPEEGVKGKELLRKYISVHTYAPKMWHKHLGMNSKINLESDKTASADTYFVRMDKTGEGRAYPLLFGRYIDKFEKCSDGKWRIKVRRIEMESTPMPPAKPA
jgi:hypothetical protein